MRISELLDPAAIVAELNGTGKKEKEKKRRKKKQDKLERREQRKIEREEGGKKSFEELIMKSLESKSSWVSIVSLRKSSFSIYSGRGRYRG